MKSKKKPVTKKPTRNPKTTVKPKPKGGGSKMAAPVVVTMVVDASSSMQHLFDATCAGFNEYVDTLKKTMQGTTYFSAITFSSLGIRKLQSGAAISDAIRLSSENYQASGSTPLLDAVGRAILATDDVVKLHTDAKAIVVIQTDGEENTSVEFTLTGLKTMIEDRQAQGWQFVFIGAGINAFADAQKMGIMTMNTMSYGANDVNTRAVYASTARNTQMYASGMAATMNYTDAQAVVAGESAAITKAKKAAAKPGGGSR